MYKLLPATTRGDPSLQAAREIAELLHRLTIALVLDSDTSTHLLLHVTIDLAETARMKR